MQSAIMFDSCQQGSGVGVRCSDVAEKLVQLFGWRQTYKVEKLQRSVPDRATTRISVTRTCGLGRKYSLDSSARQQQRQQPLGADSWVAVHNLQSQSGGGILDPDDRLSDVADDREQIIANFEDGDGVHHGGGDGASGSSVGTGSPDIFHDPEHKYGGSSYPSRTDIEITGEQIASGLITVPLQVRRGSEPALNQLPAGAEPPGPRAPVLQDPTKRWSAAPIILGDIMDQPSSNAANTAAANGPMSAGSDNNKHLPVNGRTHPHHHHIHRNGAPTSSAGSSYHLLSPEWTREDADKEDDDDDDDEEELSGPFQRIARDGSNRLSMQFLGDGAGYRWADAAERAAASSKHRIHGSTSLPRDHRRKEPLGQANNSTSPIPTSTSAHSRLAPESDNDEENMDIIVLRNEPGPLGIHVVPDYDRRGKDRGLVVQGIEPGGRIDRDGKLAIYDRIIEINGQSLLNMSFQRVQEMFKLSLIATELRLKVIKQKRNNEQTRKPPAPVYPKTGRFPEDKENVAMVEAEEQLSTNTKVATVSPTKKVPAGSRHPKSLLAANTRKIGKKIELELTKGMHGLGFSITTRDNPAGGNCPIYIKNILSKGAAVEDGRLKPGDRLLEVNGIEMTGKSQAEAVAVLRNAPPGSKVKIVVSRQEEPAVGGPVLPREIGADGSENGKSSSPVPSPNPTPPAIPPLPANHEPSSRKTPERTGSVAKIISQFQEAAKSSSNPPDKCNDDSLVFPWKHREILTFDIPVHDSEKAGLGVSVKGKTTASGQGAIHTDLGIFVKSVLHGGAASRDKRLRTNDQLLNVNGISLLQQSNSEAMETLRRAMLHTEGPVPGSITLTIARRASSPAPSSLTAAAALAAVNAHHSGRASASSHMTSSSSGPSETIAGNSLTNDTENNTTDNSGTSEGSGNTVIFLPYKQNDSPNMCSQAGKGFLDTWNPVIDRLTGQPRTQNQLRNESYYMATHDTWSASMLMGGKNSDKLTSPTVNLPSGETVIIEEEYPPNVAQDRCRIGEGRIIEKRNETEPDGKASISSSNCDKSGEPLQTNSNGNTDVTYASQLSLENPAGFSRDAFGRQSMSEKRHATLDAKNTGTYQRNKKLREEREKMKPKDDADKLGQLGPSLGMKKSSSLESLQTMVQEIQMQEEGDPAYSYRGGQGALKVIRGRGCDESFRAAVDVDYNKHLVDPNHRSETNAKKHWLLDPPEGHQVNEGTNEREIDGFTNVRGGPRQSSLNAVLDHKHKTSKKKPGILKGIGSMFRFGKHRKTDSSSSLENQPEQPEAEAESGSEQTSSEAQVSKEAEKPAAEEQRPRQRSNENQHHPHSIPEGVAVSSKYYSRENDHNVASAVARSERVHQLRSQHQQRHAERHGQYPNEDREEHYEEVIRQRLEQPGTYDGYREMGRPGSRSGITDPFRFNHYVNYDELQHQLSTRKEQLSENQIVQMRMQVQQQRLKVEEESRKQHQYHSQRQPRSDFQQRPVSNFYEYESVQSLMHSRGRQALPATHSHQNGNEPTSNSLPRHQQQHQQQQQHQHHHQHQQPQYPVNMNRHGYTQQHAKPYQPSVGVSPPYHRYVAAHNQRNFSSSGQHHAPNNRIRGPFVTHVTIGNDSSKTTGSKV